MSVATYGSCLPRDDVDATTPEPSSTHQVPAAYTFQGLIVEHLRSVHVPNILQGTAMGMRSLMIPVLAKTLGASDAVVGAIVASTGVGRTISGLPAGYFTAHVGFMAVMLSGLSVYAIAALIAGILLNVYALATACLLFGFGIGLFLTARHVMLAHSCERAKRGRLMSLVSGGERWASVIGPALGGVLMERHGLRSCAIAIVPIVIVAECCILLSPRARELNIAFLDNNRKRHAFDIEHPSLAKPRGYCAVIRSNSSVILRIGVYSMNLLQLRSCRKLLLPLAALRAGLSPATVGLVLSSSFVVDAALFFLGGLITDRFGRKFAAVPTSVNMGLCFLLLAIAGSVTSLCVVAVLFGVADCLGSGLLLTLYADHAPDHAASQFVGIMRFIQDSGQLIGPLVAGILSHHLSFEAACVTFGVLGICNGIWAALLLPSDAADTDSNCRKREESSPMSSPNVS